MPWPSWSRPCWPATTTRTSPATSARWWSCTSGCTERRYVQAHHVVHWTDGGLTDLANLVLLCWGHHHAVHEGGFTMSFEQGNVTVWRPDGALLHSESLLAQGPGIVDQNEALGLGITPESLASEWDGTRLSPELLADTVTGLLWLEDRHRRDVEMMKPPLAVEPEPPDLDDERDYPAVIVIDDDEEEGPLVAEAS